MIAYFVKRPLLVNIIILSLLVSGFLSLSILRRESFPIVNLKEAKITTIFSGDSPDDVEQLIMIPIEENLKEVEGLDQVRSISRHSMSEMDIRGFFDNFKNKLSSNIIKIPWTRQKKI